MAFNINDLVGKQIAVVLDTIEVHDAFCEDMRKHNLRMYNGMELGDFNAYKFYGSNTCYSFDGFCGTVSSFVHKGYQIIKINDIDFENDLDKERE